MAVTISQAVTSASHEPVIAAGAGRIGVSQNFWPFLPLTSNIVDGKALRFVEAHFNSNPSSTTTDEMADYLVLSTCGHALDGWRYLSQAALSLLNGARNHAIHLAYYAELRAALSILAGSGIGVLNQKHFALDDTGGVNWFNGQTHKAAWSALTEWSKVEKNALKVILCFEALGLSASEWAEACNATPSLGNMASYWLQDWSVDLNSLTDDRILRNEATYRPDLRTTAFKQLTLDEIELIYGISSGCAFYRNGRFEPIDLVLVHDLCIKACESRFGNSDDRTMHKVWNDIYKWIRSHREPDQRSSVRLITTLKKASNSLAGKIIQYANPSNVDVAGVFSRAFLLLRLASALVRLQWNDIRVRSGGGTSAWQSTALASFGVWSNLWESTNPPTDYGMLDMDRIAAEDALESWLVANNAMVPYKMLREIPSSIIELCRFERIGILAVAQ